MLTCPFPINRYPHITLAHGGGGLLTQQLLDEIVKPAFASPYLSTAHDGGIITLSASKVAVTTDSYVVSPYIFPGGNIGKLAVCGSINDLAVCGATPLGITVSLILEEGFATTAFIEMVHAIAHEASTANVPVVAGDLKVVERGAADKIFITTTAIGSVPSHITIEPRKIQESDCIIVTGDVGRHGLTLMMTRENLALGNSVLRSDCACLHRSLLALIENGVEVHCMRDLTRGGLATALNEIATTAGHELELHEAAVLLDPTVVAASELLGLDPLYAACEGTALVIVPPEHAEMALKTLRSFAETATSYLSGRVGPVAHPRGMVLLRTRFGATRILPVLSGEQLPRIC